MYFNCARSHRVRALSLLLSLYLSNMPSLNASSSQSSLSSLSCSSVIEAPPSPASTGSSASSSKLSLDQEDEGKLHSTAIAFMVLTPRYLYRKSYHHRTTANIQASWETEESRVCRVFFVTKSQSHTGVGICAFWLSRRT